MRKLIIPTLALCILGFQGFTFGQDSKEAKTLFKNNLTINTEDLGFMVAPSFGVSEMDGSTVSLFNLRGGLVFKDKFSFGAYCSVSLNEINPRSETVPDVYMDYWSAGGVFEYTLFSKKLVHVTTPVLIGVGEVEMDNEIGEAELGEKQFLQIEPSLLLEVNLHKYVRLNLGASYRVVNNMKYRNLDQTDISGFNALIGLKFGLF